MLYRDMARVKSFGLVRYIHDKANSVQPALKAGKPVTARAGKASGSTILKNN